MSTVKAFFLKHPSSPLNNITMEADGTTRFANAALTGLDHVVTVNFVGQTAVNVDNCFTSKYDNYRIVCRMTTAAGASIVYLRFRAAGASDSSALYNYARSTISSSVSGVQNFTQTIGELGISNASNGHWVSEVLNPRVAATTEWSSFGWRADNYNSLVSGNFNAATQFDGFNLTAEAASAMSGVVRVYGYRNG